VERRSEDVLQGAEGAIRGESQAGPDHWGEDQHEQQSAAAACHGCATAAAWLRTSGFEWLAVMRSIQAAMYGNKVAESSWCSELCLCVPYMLLHMPSTRMQTVLLGHKAGIDDNLCMCNLPSLSVSKLERAPFLKQEVFCSSQLLSSASLNC